MTNGTNGKVEEAPSTKMVVTESLPDLADEMAELLVALEDEMEKTGGEIVEGQMSEALVAKVEKLQLKVNAKTDGYAAVIKFFEGRSKSISTLRKDENERMMKREARDANKARNLRKLLAYAMKRLGLRKIEGLKYDIAFQMPGGVDPLELKQGVPDAPLLADAALQKIQKQLPTFCKVSVSWDTKAIREALESDDKKLKAAAERLAEIKPRQEFLAIR